MRAFQTLRVATLFVTRFVRLSSLRCWPRAAKEGVSMTMRERFNRKACQKFRCSTHWSGVILVVGTWSAFEFVCDL